MKKSQTAKAQLDCIRHDCAQWHEQLAKQRQQISSLRASTRNLLQLSRWEIAQAWTDLAQAQARLEYCRGFADTLRDSCV